MEGGEGGFSTVEAVDGEFDDGLVEVALEAREARVEEEEEGGRRRREGGGKRGRGPTCNT
jgi:hypothetical protein